MATHQREEAPPRLEHERPPPWRDIRVLRVFFQVAFLVAVAVLLLSTLVFSWPSKSTRIGRGAAHQPSRLAGLAEQAGWHAHQKLDERAMREWVGVVEVLQRLRWLQAMGAGIEGAGSPTIRVEGTSALQGAKRTLWGDYIEAGSWAVVAAITGGNVEIGGTRWQDMEVVCSVLKKMNVHCEHDGRLFRAEPRTLINAGRITTGLWPGFPSDLVSLATALATQAAGATLVHDWLYELRLYSLEQVAAMGADLRAGVSGAVIPGSLHTCRRASLPAALPVETARSRSISPLKRRSATLTRRAISFLPARPSFSSGATT